MHTIDVTDLKFKILTLLQKVSELFNQSARTTVHKCTILVSLSLPGLFRTHHINPI